MSKSSMNRCEWLYCLRSKNYRLFSLSIDLLYIIRDHFSLVPYSFNNFIFSFVMIFHIIIGFSDKPFLPCNIFCQLYTVFGQGQSPQAIFARDAYYEGGRPRGSATTL